MTIRLKHLVKLHNIVMALKKELSDGDVEDIAIVERRSIIREGKRFKIYLPTDENPLWEYLHENHCDVDVILIIRGCRGNGS